MPISLRIDHSNYLPHILMASAFLHIAWFSFYLPLPSHSLNHQPSIKKLSTPISLRFFRLNNNLTTIQSTPKNEKPIQGHSSEYLASNTKKATPIIKHTDQIKKTTKSIKLTSRYINPIHTERKQRSLWRNLSVTPIEKINPPITSQANNIIIEQLHWEKEARIAQLIWSWEQWWQQAIETGRFQNMPDSARCHLVEQQWKCIFDDIPFNPISLDGQIITDAFNAFRNTLGGDTIKLSRNEKQQWQIENIQ